MLHIFYLLCCLLYCIIADVLLSKIVERDSEKTKRTSPVMDNTCDDVPQLFFCKLVLHSFAFPKKLNKRELELKKLALRNLLQKQLDKLALKARGCSFHC